MTITKKGYGKPCLQPAARLYTRGYLSHRWNDEYGFRPSKRRLRRQLAALNRKHGKRKPILMHFATARNMHR